MVQLNLNVFFSQYQDVLISYLESFKKQNIYMRLRDFFPFPFIYSDTDQ